jgi:DNA end-binding protein Ku
MAEQLIGAMTAEFDPAAYHDDYREALLKLIEDKVAGQETVEPVAPQPATNIVDLMAALEASVKAAVEARGTVPPTPVGAVRDGAWSAGRKRSAAAAKDDKKSKAKLDVESEASPPASRRKSA